MAKYLRFAELPPSPASCDYTPAAAPVLSLILGNDVLGDCVIAGGYHVVGLATGNAGDLYTVAESDVIADYSAIGGYIPGVEATDNGCDEVVAMQYWQTHGFANGTKIAGAVAVDATNQAEVRAACWLFEHLYLAVELPDPWIQPMPTASGFTWDTAGDPDPNNGHCIVGCGYHDGGVTIDTWGMLGTLTWAALAQYFTEAAGGALYVMLTPDVVVRATGKAPTGFDWATLSEDFTDIGGSPAPAP
jgi:hypothetical protein